MKIYLGTDILEISRIKDAIDNYGAKFLEKIFTDNEIKFCSSNTYKQAERFAVRFAIKEAVSKALKAGINKLGWDKGINWKDVETIKLSNGEISVVLYGKALGLAKQFGITTWELSASHSKYQATAAIIGYTDG
ncbi:MAG: holo-ACP synthase [Candidatus Gastranaerophilales bacterium]|nr:holo-ACP synthase [Candidatus Gastranaerophilales bacterium]